MLQRPNLIHPSVRRMVAFAMSVVCLATFCSAASAAPSNPVVVELFTSQSCSSCPPAEAYLNTLSSRPDVLALSFHVDYWNHLGWVDRFSSPAFTARQRDYASSIGTSVYTPQIVVDGRQDVVGSNQRDVERAISRAKDRQSSVQASVSTKGGRIEIDVAKATIPTQSARLLLLTFDPQATDAIATGENAGRVIRSANIVRSLRSVGSWTGTDTHISESLGSEESGQRIALLVQDKNGRVIAAAVAQ